MLVVDLAQELSIIEVSGADSSTYLQGQLTNDIKLLNTQKFILAAHLNNKGRMLASFIITRTDENTYHLITHKEIVNKILLRLKMYVLRSKVVLKELEESTLVFSDHIINSAIYSLELTIGKFISLQNKQPEYETKDTKHWHRFLVNHGLAIVYPETYEELIPEQVNYDLIGGINFKKGCYTGQEIVARMHYLGKAKRRMYRFICDTSVYIGQKIISPKLDNQEVGIVIDITKRDYDYLGLVSIQNDCVEDAFISDSEDILHQLLIQELTYQEHNG